MSIQRSPRLAGLNSPGMRAALYYARKRRLARQGGGNEPTPSPGDPVSAELAITDLNIGNNGDRTIDMSAENSGNYLTIFGGQVGLAGGSYNHDLQSVTGATIVGGDALNKVRSTSFESIDTYLLNFASTPSDTTVFDLGVTTHYRSQMMMYEISDYDSENIDFYDSVLDGEENAIEINVAEGDVLIGMALVQLPSLAGDNALSGIYPRGTGELENVDRSLVLMEGTFYVEVRRSDPFEEAGTISVYHLCNDQNTDRDMACYIHLKAVTA